MDDTNPKPFVFVLMPFSDDFTDIYEVGIKPACKDAGAYCERVDEQKFDESILERIYNQIDKADIIVADMTDRNPNVFYETGYVHALNKRVILLTQNAEDIPFDLKHYPHIVYGGKISSLKSQLESRIRWCIDNPRDSLKTVDINLEVFINDIAVDNNPEIEVPVYGGSEFHAYFTIQLHNSADRIMRTGSFTISIIVPEILRSDYRDKNTRFIKTLPDKRRLYNLKHANKLFPDHWESIPLAFQVEKEQIPDMPIRATVRVFTELKPKDYECSLKLHLHE
jgi:hypothetical protein